MNPTHAPRSAKELSELLRSRTLPRIRLCGSGSRAARTPAPPRDAAIVSLGGMASIERLAADDLTCSVQPGVSRIELDAALAPHGLELACAGGGTLGGLFASDPIGATTAGGAQPRTLLLGVEAVLADGTPFKAGARVVKSVAGFDVHKLFVGSRGRLFAATLLHLKLRPRPRACESFALDGLDAATAVAKLTALRALASGVSRLWLRRDVAGIAIGGTLAGRAAQVKELLHGHALRESATDGADHLEATTGHEVVTGIVRWSRVPSLLAALPAGAPLLLHGGGRFETMLLPAASDALLSLLPSLDAAGCIACGSDARRGRGTPLDAGAERLQQALARALDPTEVFA